MNEAPPLTATGPDLRRAVDLAVSASLLATLWPVMAVVALAVCRRLGPPALFRQQRSGLHGREFTIYKFRTMRPEDFPGEPDADRDTPLGRRLRQFSLDELPQLWNIARGDMSFIGPRPTLPEQVQHYSDRQRGRLAVRPGLTGWAQVNGRNSIGWPERIELDLWYIAHRSWRLDLQIVLKTVHNVLRPRGILGTDGVNPGFPAPAGSGTVQGPHPGAGRPPFGGARD